MRLCQRLHMVEIWLAVPAISYANAHSEITEVMLKLYIYKGEDDEQSICS